MISAERDQRVLPSPKCHPEPQALTIRSQPVRHLGNFHLLLHERRVWLGRGAERAVGRVGYPHRGGWRRKLL